MKNKRPKLYRRTDPKKYRDSPQRKERKKFYQSAKWRRFRAKLFKKRAKKDRDKGFKLYETDRRFDHSEMIEWLLSESPLCQHCIKEYRLKAATVADHIMPIRDGGAEFDPENIQFLCAPHHNSKSGKESNG